MRSSRTSEARAKTCRRRRTAAASARFGRGRRWMRTRADRVLAGRLARRGVGVRVHARTWVTAARARAAHRTAISPIWRRWKRRSGWTSTTPCSRRSTARTLAQRRATVRRLHRLQGGDGCGRSESEAYFDALCGASEPRDADVDAPLHAADERLQQEGGEPRGGHRALVHVLQRRPYPSDAPRAPGDGGWRGEPCVERRGNRRVARLNTPSL